jgi:hypothetical protein
MILIKISKIKRLLFKGVVKNASAALPGSVTSADFDLSPGTISALTNRHLNLS